MFSTSGSALRRLLTGLCLALSAAVLTVPVTADAATSDAHPEIVQCFNDFPFAGCVDNTPAGFTPVDVEISSDGKQLYLLGADGTVTIVDRAADGILTPRTGAGSCFNDLGDNGCTGLDGLGGEATDLTLSDDGTSVYVASSGAVASLVRTPSSGDLTPSACYSAGSAGCTVVSQLGSNVNGVVVSPGSLNVYARSDDRLLAFDRASPTGLLTLKADEAGCYTETLTADCDDRVGLVGNGVELAVSPDGANLYVPTTDGLAVFTRIAGGSLQQAAGTAGGCITSSGASTTPGECQTFGTAGGALELAEAVTISPSGKHVFVSGNDGSGAFARSASTGLLTLTDCLSRQDGVPGCQDGDGVAGSGVEVSPDGTRAIVGGGDIAGFGVFDFDEVTGRFTQLPGAEGCFSGSLATGCTPIPGGFFSQKAAWAPDGMNAYVTMRGNLLNVLQDHPPVCTSATVTVKANTSKSIPLSCTDANGDTLTSIQASGASKGRLGTVANGSVVYTPPKDFTGTATFSVTGTADGRTGPPATITVKVPDTLVVLKIRSTTVKLDAKGKAKVKLTCSALEEHGPCSGTLTIKTRGKVPSGGRKVVVTLTSAKYRIKAGATKAVVVQLSPAARALVRRVADARKLKLVAKVKDTRGNKATVTKRATLRLP